MVFQDAVDALDKEDNVIGIRRKGWSRILVAGSSNKLEDYSQRVETDAELYMEDYVARDWCKITEEE